jgi:hypothetical protein
LFHYFPSEKLVVNVAVVLYLFINKNKGVFMNITEEKIRLIFVVCCVLATAAIIFNTVASFVQRNNIEDAILRSFKTYGIERELEKMSDKMK